MPNRTVKRNSVVDMLKKVPVHRGSLLTGIENLLKTIESSENAVMIPTLLRDKCDFDAWELLFVAKILKASILGHVDLVEFYMNHIGLNSAQFSQQSSATTPTTPTAAHAPSSGGFTSNADHQTGSNRSLSPSINGVLNGSSPLRQSSPVASSPTGDGLQPNGQFNPIGSNNAPQQLSSPSNSTSSISIAAAVQQQAAPTATTSASSASTLSGSGGSWSLAPEQQLPLATPSEMDAASAGSCAADSVMMATVAAAAATNRPHAGRQAQPPSLLQLTTTNNHINRSFTSSHIEQLSQQFQQQQQQQQLISPLMETNAALLSISTTAANQQSATGSLSGSYTLSNGPAPATSSTTGTVPPAELRSSRSAGCLFRLNSGASSPRTPLQTPTTPYPQAETLANGLQKGANGLAGDPSAPVKLLLQIEQLKLSISHVTGLLESVVELYKKSIDNIALA